MRYHVAVERDADAVGIMPFRSITFEVTADSEDDAEMIVDNAIVRMVGLGQLTIDSVYELA